MGGLFSRAFPAVSFIEAERKTWIEHKLIFDETVKKDNVDHLLKLNLFENGSEIYLGYSSSAFGGVKFDHFFVTDKNHFLEFGGVNLDIYNARVAINTNVRDGYELTKSRKMDEVVRERMKEVLGEFQFFGGYQPQKNGV